MRMICAVSLLGLICSGYLSIPPKNFPVGAYICLGLAFPSVAMTANASRVKSSTTYRMRKRRLDKILQDSRIMVLATHSNELIKQTCNKVLVLEGGSQVYFGDIDGWDFERAAKIDDASEQLSVPQVIES